MVTTASGNVKTVQGGKLKEYFRFIKKQCLPIGILLGLLIVVALVGQVISLPIFRAASYRELLDVQEGDFVTDVKEISFSEIPMLDEDSARYLSTTQMGTIPDMASQFEVTYDSTQINYQGAPSGWRLWSTPTSSSGSPTAPRACPPTSWWTW